MIMREEKKVGVKKKQTNKKKKKTQIKELRQLITWPGNKIFRKKLKENHLRKIKKSLRRCRPVLVT